MDPTYPGGYSDRAHAFHELADGILAAHEIYPYRHYRDLTALHSELGLHFKLEGKPVQYGRVELGICIKQETPDLDFAPEVIWLYEQAVKDYIQALKLDPTEILSRLKLPHVLRQLGRENEGAHYLSEALAILNKAIMADDWDGQSYSERAQVWEELDKIELAISDLERMLTLSTSNLDIDHARSKIEDLRKRREARGTGGAQAVLGS